MRNDIRWNENLKIGNSMIDSDHKKIFEMLEVFYNSIQTGSESAKLQLLENLAAYAMAHFKREEEHMEKIGYKGIEAHKKIHNQFKNTVSDWIERSSAGKMLLSVEITNFISKWLITHICQVDQKINK